MGKSPGFDGGTVTQALSFSRRLPNSDTEVGERLRTMQTIIVLIRSAAFWKARKNSLTEKLLLKPSARTARLKPTTKVASVKALKLLCGPSNTPAQESRYLRKCVSFI